MNTMRLRSGVTKSAVLLPPPRAAFCREGGEEAVKRRPTRRSGVELEINMWGLKDLPKTSTVKKGE